MGQNTSALVFFVQLNVLPHLFGIYGIFRTRNLFRETHRRSV